MPSRRFGFARRLAPLARQPFPHRNEVVGREELGREHAPGAALDLDVHHIEEVRRQPQGDDLPDPHHHVPADDLHPLGEPLPPAGRGEMSLDGFEVLRLVVLEKDGQEDRLGRVALTRLTSGPTVGGSHAKITAIRTAACAAHARVRRYVQRRTESAPLPTLPTSNRSRRLTPPTAMLLCCIRTQGSKWRRADERAAFQAEAPVPGPPAHRGGARARRCPREGLRHRTARLCEVARALERDGVKRPSGEQGPWTAAVLEAELARINASLDAAYAEHGIGA